jgi:hypothetical protein
VTFQTAEATYRRFKALLDEGAVSRLRLDEVALGITDYQGGVVGLRALPDLLQ